MAEDAQGGQGDKKGWRKEDKTRWTVASQGWLFPSTTSAEQVLHCLCTTYYFATYVAYTSPMSACGWASWQVKISNLRSFELCRLVHLFDGSTTHFDKKFQLIACINMIHMSLISCFCGLGIHQEDPCIQQEQGQTGKKQNCLPVCPPILQCNL